MAETDNLHQYKSLSIDELHNLLFNAIKEMCNASDAKDHKTFLEKQNEVYVIKTIIAEKKDKISN